MWVFRPCILLFSLQVLVDIDDTIRSSGGVTFLSVSLGGIDTQYERGSFYPGCFQFLLDLSTHGLRRDQKPLTLGVLTARIPQVSQLGSHCMVVRLISEASSFSCCRSPLHIQVATSMSTYRPGTARHCLSRRSSAYIQAERESSESRR